jgi:hypothetical protein
MRATKSGKSMPKSDGRRRVWEFVIGTGRRNVGYGVAMVLRTHVDADVPGHIGSVGVSNFLYDESAKHVGTNLHANCAGVSLSTSVIGA